MIGTRKDLVTPSRAGLYYSFTVNPDDGQTMDDWEAQAYIHALTATSVSVVTLTTEIDATAETITISSSDLSAMTQDVEYGYRVLVNPGLSYGVQFFYGTITKVEGGVAWT